jgi:tetratricopeptide (TPR) repeat protein
VTAALPLRALVAAAVLLAAAASAGAASPLVAELEAAASRYHEEPARLDRLRDGLREAARAEPGLEHLVALARACYLWGDVRATSRDQKLAAYDEGREAGRRAVELAPRSALAHLWYAINTARWGQANGIVRSLFLLPTVREEIRTVLELDPKLPGAYALAGNVNYEVPGLLGGDLDRAEEMFRRGLALDPRFTGLRVGLAKTLAKKGRAAEARAELTAVLEERAPTNPADWTVKDVPEARRLLATLPAR